MAPTWLRTGSTSENDDSSAAWEAARHAALRRRDVYIAIRAHLTTVYPSHPNLIVRSQQTAGANGMVNYVAVVLYETSPPSRLTPATPVINYDAQYYDDRLLSEEEMKRFTVLLNGTPGRDQTEGMRRLLERIEVLGRSGWRGS